MQTTFSFVLIDKKKSKSGERIPYDHLSNDNVTLLGSKRPHESESDETSAGSSFSVPVRKKIKSEDDAAKAVGKAKSARKGKERA
jgi:hypothetical protein